MHPGREANGTGVPIERADVPEFAGYDDPHVTGQARTRPGDGARSGERAGALSHLGGTRRPDVRGHGGSAHAFAGAAPAMLSVADILRSKGVTATFFDTGAHDSANPDVVRQVASMGFLIANHTWDHDYPDQTSSGWTVEYLRDQMARTSALQQRLTGRPVCFFRPPGGNLTNVLTAASAEGMSTVLWSVDARDWAQPGQNDPESVAKIVERATSLDSEDDQNPIVLMHVAKASHEPEAQVSSFRGNTIAALPQIIDWYADHGYRFVDLLGHDASPTPLQ
ncbi:polysaccharide deacetylase family protein [Actinopolymorpha pittospori]|uniref:Peptidoglycan/xylan/chitin deacetylase (PgdA/CDA1 family) n=1 Tax=Actinopolymorpha pittospori TaxID=648752 RepID=A0A927R7T2_9ACTN|nr:peptidoglycan/xylan/chitin deacetylase (PgdA/CDA1 family) [Actinopolymorpha pittospori]